MTEWGCIACECKNMSVRMIPSIDVNQTTFDKFDKNVWSEIKLLG